MTLLTGFFKSTSREVDILRHDVAIFKNLIKERQHPLDLVRELLSNAGARQVGATRLEVSYTKDKQGHVFEVSDDGCGMDFCTDENNIGRLNRFLGLGLSSIVGEQADEFSCKGLGSKLSYQSRRVVLETRCEGEPLYEVRINEPWESLNSNIIPRPRITEHKDPDCPTGTRIKVLGHPPHRQEEPFTLEEIRRFLLHRTFVGFTRPRTNPPRVLLSVMGQMERLEFGFPEFHGVEFPQWLALDLEREALLVNMSLVRPPLMSVSLKGIITWNPEPFGLKEGELNTGLILSSRGIPFFELPLEGFGAQRLAKSSPGSTRVCLVADCDQVYSEMNISRSALVDSAITLEFRKMLAQLFEHLLASEEYRQFRQVRQKSRRAARVASIAQDRRLIRSDEQRWVVLERPGSPPTILMREPRNDTEVIAMLGKLESLGALPFQRFQTVAHPGPAATPDLFVHFQEESTAPAGIAMFEAENLFYSYKRRDDLLADHPSVICWDVPARGRRVRLNKTKKKYKFTVEADDRQVPVYVMKLMDGLQVLSTRELRDRGVQI